MQTTVSFKTPLQNMNTNIKNLPIVAIVDDDYAVRDALELMVELAGFICKTFESAEDFLQHSCPEQPCVLLLDVNLPGMNGFELQAELIRQNIAIPIIFMSGRSHLNMMDEAMKAGAVDFFSKPIRNKQLLNRIHDLCIH